MMATPGADFSKAIQDALGAKASAAAAAPMAPSPMQPGQAISGQQASNQLAPGQPFDLAALAAAEPAESGKKRVVVLGVIMAVIVGLVMVLLWLGSSGAL